MASIKISELNEKTSLESEDLLPIVDTINDETKKTTFGNLKEKIHGDNFYVIMGVQTLTASQTGHYDTQTTWQLDYPTGFNMNNCVVVAFNLSNANMTTVSWGEYGYNFSVSMGLLYSMIPRAIAFRENKIYVNAWFPGSSDTDFNYKIVLMKIR